MSGSWGTRGDRASDGGGKLQYQGAGACVLSLGTLQMGAQANVLFVWGRADRALEVGGDGYLEQRVTAERVEHHVELLLCALLRRGDAGQASGLEGHSVGQAV